MKIMGIDPGVETGVALWDDVARKFTHVLCLKIHQAMDLVRELKPDVVIFEDARQRNWFGGRDAKQEKFGAGVREGVGSVKRDCGIWEDFLKELGVKYIARAPAAKSTKWKADKFKKVTGWEGRTNEHARDAAVLVYGITGTQVELIRRQSESRVAALQSARATRCKRKGGGGRGRKQNAKFLEIYGHLLELEETAIDEELDAAT
jgi:hypothetical protein